MDYRRKNKLVVVNMGVKMFCKNKGNQESECGFRIRSEGLEILLPYLGDKRKIRGTRQLFKDFTNTKDMMLTYE